MKESDYLIGNIHLIEMLKKFPVFKPLNESDFNKLLRISKLKTYKSGEFIVVEGETNPWMYFLVKGKVKICKNGKEIVTLEKRGDVFGEMGVITKSPRSASAYAEGDTICLSTDFLFMDKIAGNDKIVFSYLVHRIFTEIVVERLRKTTDELINLKGKINLKFW
jgi:CRP-like cAMP-binding protein